MHRHGEPASPLPEYDQPLFGLEDTGQFEANPQIEEEGILLTPEQFTAIFYEGGEAAEKAKQELREAHKASRGQNNG